MSDNPIASMARDRLVSQIDYDRVNAIREAQEIVEEAQQIAGDIDRAVSLGKIPSLAQKVHHLLVRSTQLGVRKEALELFDAALPEAGEGE